MTGELMTSTRGAVGASTPAERGVRSLSDETLVVIVSDTHIGGDAEHDIFQSAPALTALFGELAARPGPVELVLGGDFFDFLRIAECMAGTYLWVSNMVLIDRLTRPRIEAVIEHLRHTGAFAQVFSRLFDVPT